MKNYQKFVESLMAFKWAKESGREEEFLKRIKIPKGEKEWRMDEWGELIAKSEDSKVFEVEEDIKKLLVLTKAPNKNTHIRLPFRNIFIDTYFNREKDMLNIEMKELWGILLSKSNYVIAGKKKDKPMGEGVTATVYGMDDKGDIWFDSYYFDVHIFEDRGLPLQYRNIHTPKTRKFIINFVLNFLNFLNDPRIEVIERIRSEKNIKRRLKQGKVYLPSSKLIKLTGELKVYYEKLKSQGAFSYGYKFWVRGHWRTLRDPKYWGKKAGTRLWIIPFIKGEGILVDKVYDLIKKEN